MPGLNRRDFLMTGVAAASGISLAGVVGSAGAVTSKTIAGNVRMPIVTGPVQGGRHGRPFGSYLGDVGAFGYVEEEYFIEGHAISYKPVGELGADGKWTVEPAEGKDYRTRILVRRPRDPSKFNGTVILDWLNVSTGRDLSQVGTGQFEGFAYVGLSNQYVGVNGFPQQPGGLRGWDSERYGSLSLPADSLCFDILTQAAAAVGPARRGRSDPLAGLAVRRLIATGASQSATKLTAYLNGVQPLVKLIDGFVPTVNPGFGAGFDDALWNPQSAGGAQAIRSLMRVSTRLRDDAAAKVIIVSSEAETLSSYSVRQPDSDRFRLWEVAGSAHAPATLVRRAQAMFARDGVAIGTPARPVLNLPASEVDWIAVADAAIMQIHQWVNGGPPPSKQPKIETRAGTGAAPEIVRDPFGNAVGGVRLPELEVPIARYGDTTAPFTPQELKRLYPTRADYVSRVTAAARSAEAAGVILPAIAQAYIAAAGVVRFPTP